MCGKHYIMIYIISWLVVGLFGAILAVGINWYKGNNLELQDLLTLIYCIGAGWLAPIIVITVFVYEYLENNRNIILIKGRKTTLRS